MSTGPVEDLLAKQAITEVVYRYCRALDRMDRRLALTCWHLGATVDYGDAYRGSAEGFVDWLWPLHRDVFVAHSHQITNVLIDVDGDRAASESYVTVTLRSGTTPERAMDLVGRGRYLDRWSKRAGRWAMDHRRHVTDIRSTYAPSGADPAGTASASRRDPTDPSYEVLHGLSSSSRRAAP